MLRIDFQNDGRWALFIFYFLFLFVFSSFQIEFLGRGKSFGFLFVLTRMLGFRILSVVFFAVQKQLLSWIKLLKAEGEKGQSCSVSLAWTCRMCGTSQMSFFVVRYYRRVALGEFAVGQGIIIFTELEKVICCKELFIKQRLVLIFLGRVAGRQGRGWVSVLGRFLLKYLLSVYYILGIGKGE